MIDTLNKIHKSNFTITLIHIKFYPHKTPDRYKPHSDICELH